MDVGRVKMGEDSRGKEGYEWRDEEREKESERGEEMLKECSSWLKLCMIYAGGNWILSL